MLSNRYLIRTSIRLECRYSSWERQVIRVRLIITPRERNPAKSTSFSIRHESLKTPYSLRSITLPCSPEHDAWRHEIASCLCWKVVSQRKSSSHQKVSKIKCKHVKKNIEKSITYSLKIITSFPKFAENDFLVSACGRRITFTRHDYQPYSDYLTFSTWIAAFITE